VAGQIATAYYFAHFLVILPILGIIDNVLSSVGTHNSSPIKEKSSGN
jgi:hypothetical protein